MPVDINTKILTAFQVEHKEQLEGIRAALGNVADRDDPESRQRIEEAFRLAHSMKGGARVCDLKSVQTLGHGLENVFEQVREGTLSLDEDVTATIHLVLDRIEDWMAAFERGEEPADSRNALAAIDGLLNNGSVAEMASAETNQMAERLLKAFQAECQQYIAGLREFVSRLNNHSDRLTSDDLEEAFRYAHNLRGAAHAAEVTIVEQGGESLERLIGGLRDQTVPMDQATCATIQQHLDGIEREMKALGATVPHAATTSYNTQEAVLPRDIVEREIAVAEPSDKTTVAQRASSGHQVDTVRVSTESLDRLLRSSRQLQFESLRQDQVAGALNLLRRQLDDMQREREAVRRAAATSLHLMSTMPEFNRLTRYFDSVDRGVRSLVRGTRQVCLAHKKNTWMLKSRGQQIQRDVKQARMVPAETVFQGFRRLVRDLAKEQGKKVDFNVVGFDLCADRMVLQALKDPLIHILRNCLVHGIESPREREEAGKDATGRIDLRIETTGNRLTIEVDDDGRGINHKKIISHAVTGGLVSQSDVSDRSPEDFAGLIFQPGFTTTDEVTEIAGRGMGLSVVHETASKLQGEVSVCPTEGPGTKMRISVPLSISTHRLLLVSAGGRTYAIPVHGIARLLRLKLDEIETVEGKPIVTFEGQPLPLVSLAHALGVDNEQIKANAETLAVLILKSGTRRVAVSVDGFLAERDLLIQDLDGAAAMKQFLGAVILEHGDVALVLHPTELLDNFRSRHGKLVIESLPTKQEKRTSRVLVVDDSFTTRTLEKSILEANGYQVAIAVDGVEALGKLKGERYDLVISDVEMPRMDGFTLLEEIKKDQRLSSTPVILVTSCDRSEHQARGLDLGADAYIVKQKFDHESLLNTIRQIVGETAARPTVNQESPIKYQK